MLLFFFFTNMFAYQNHLITNNMVIDWQIRLAPIKKHIKLFSQSILFVFTYEYECTYFPVGNLSPYKNYCLI